MGRPDPRLMFMQSNGGLTDARLFQGKDAILSGPAGGVVGMVQTAAMDGTSKVIGFDMGGTSTDVAHYDGDYERSFETMVAGVRLRAPMMHIHTVAAGGGSILYFDGARYRVGPGSAGANPGPACYRRGGPLAVTDCNVMLGKIQPDFFPHVFGPAATSRWMPRSCGPSSTPWPTRSRRPPVGPRPAPEAVAEGFLRIAVENMANAIKKISVQRGYDVTEYTLNCFGGAGGQHACPVADTLGMTRVLLHPFAGVLSAYGMGLADVRALREGQIELPLMPRCSRPSTRPARRWRPMPKAEVAAQGVADEQISVFYARCIFAIAGTDTALLVDAGAVDAMRGVRGRAQGSSFGFISPERSLVVEAVSVEAVSASPTASKTRMALGRRRADARCRRHRGHVCRRRRGATRRCSDREDLVRARPSTGPAIIVEATGDHGGRTRLAGGAERRAAT